MQRNWTCCGCVTEVALDVCVHAGLAEERTDDVTVFLVKEIGVLAADGEFDCGVAALNDELRRGVVADLEACRTTMPLKSDTGSFSAPARISTSFPGTKVSALLSGKSLEDAAPSR